MVLPGEIQLPAQRLVVAFLLGYRRAHGLTVARHQPAAHDRIQAAVSDACGGQLLREGLDLVVEEVECEVIRCVRRQSGLPVANQVGTQHQCQRQHQQGEGEAQQLGAGQPGLADQATAGQPGREARRPGRAGEQRQQAADRGQAEQGRRGQAAQQQGREPDIPELRQQQAGDQRQCAAAGQPGIHRRRGQLAIEYPQCRRARQAEQGRQREGQQHQRCQQQGEQQPPGGQLGRCLRNAFAQPGEQPRLQAPAQQAAEHARRQPQHQVLQQEQAQDAACRVAEAADQCRAVQVPAGMAAGGQADGDAGQGHRRQAGQAQEALGSLQGIADQGTAAAHVDQRLSRRELRRQPGLPGLERRPRARDEVAPVHTAAGLHHAGRGQVVEVHQEAWRHVEEVARPARLVAEKGDHAQGRGPHLQRIADADAEQAAQPGLDPDRARPWRCRRAVLAMGRCCAARFAAQGKGVVDGTHAGELEGLARADHAGEFQRGRPRQTERRRPLQPVLGDRRRAAQHQVGPQQLRALQRQPPLQAIGGEPDQQGHRHGQHQAGGEQLQLAGTRIARQPAQGQSCVAAHGLRPPAGRRRVPVADRRPRPAARRG